MAVMKISICLEPSDTTLTAMILALSTHFYNHHQVNCIFLFVHRSALASCQSLVLQSRKVITEAEKKLKETEKV